MTHLTILLLTFSAVLAASGQLLFKVGAREANSLVDFFNLPIIIGLVFYACSTAIWIYTLSYSKLVNVYAFTALTFVLVYAGGVFIIDEEIALAGMVGIFMILVGLYLITSFNA
jgi:multidrug transporter EmrE-like cation transporter